VFHSFACITSQSSKAFAFSFLQWILKRSKVLLLRYVDVNDDGAVAFDMMEASLTLSNELQDHGPTTEMVGSVEPSENMNTLHESKL
jgi:hypothetical protein